MRRPLFVQRKELMSTEDIYAMLGRMGVREATEQRKAVASLQETGVISARPNRRGIASSKEVLVKETLQGVFLWRCRRGDCQREVSDSRRPVLLVEAEACGALGHSPRSALLNRLGEVLHARGVGNVLLVGGTEAYWREIQSGSPATLNWRFIDGKTVKDDRYYRSHKEWADLTVIWASTPLNHKVSQKFPTTGRRGAITAPGRGVEAMIRDVLEALTEDSRN